MWFTSPFVLAFAYMFMSQLPGGIVLKFKSLTLTANWTMGDTLGVPLGVANVIVV